MCCIRMPLEQKVQRTYRRALLSAVSWHILKQRGQLI